LCAAVLAAGCATSGPSAPPPGKGRTEPAPRCELGTLGLEAGPITGQLRRKLALPESAKGAVVVEVLPGSPAAAAGIRPNDIIEEIGTARITNACELVDAAYSRSCEPVRVVLRRAGEIVEAKLIPVDQDPFYEGSCRAGIPSGCFRQAWTLWSRNRSTDRDRALEIYQTACRSGSAEACAYGGLRLMETANRGRDSIALVERSCELGSAGGCTTLAFFYATGKVVGKDDRRATALYVKGCDLGDPRGCYNVGLMADEGRGTARDVSRAVAKYGQACDSGSSTACTNLGFHYENGKGVKKDSARAFALYQRGCEGTSCEPPNLTGCVNVGRAYRDGIGVGKDATRAATIFQGACDRKPDRDDVNADDNRSRACSLIGALYLSGDGVEKNVATGLRLSELGCERGDSFGCFNAAAVYASGAGVEADAAKAASFLEKACQGGDGEGCYDLGIDYEKGTGVARDRRRAAELFRKACALGFQRACAKKGK
jgi:uncharacterized protein